MIKKLLSIAAIACFSSSIAQNIELRNFNGTAIINGQTLTVVDTIENDVLQDIQLDIDATSKYTASTNIRVKKIEITTTAPLSENAICWGVCTPNIVWGTSPIVLSPQIPMSLNQKITFNGHYYPKLQEGISTFKYVWFDVANATDSAFIIVNYDMRNPNAVSVKEISKETSINVYPNPARDFINVSLKSNEDNKTIEIIDLLGKKLFASSIADNSTNLRINTSSYLPGVYFLTVRTGMKSIKTSKIIITK